MHYVLDPHVLIAPYRFFGSYQIPTISSMTHVSLSVYQCGCPNPCCTDSIYGFYTNIFTISFPEFIEITYYDCQSISMKSFLVYSNHNTNSNEKKL